MSIKTLKKWAIVGLGEYRISGYVYNHDRFEDGKRIVTSPVVGINEDNDLITESGSVYHLEEPDPTYEALYPNSKQRVFDSIRKKTQTLH